MWDNLDRMICADAERDVRRAFTEDWDLIRHDFNDPGMLLVFKHQREVPWVPGARPTVSVTIEYGTKPRRKSPVGEKKFFAYAAQDIKTNWFKFIWHNRKEVEDWIALRHSSTRDNDRYRLVPLTAMVDVRGEANESRD